MCPIVVHCYTTTVMEELSTEGIGKKKGGKLVRENNYLIPSFVNFCQHAGGTGVPGLPAQ